MADDIARDIHKRLIAMGVDVGDENAIMAGVTALREALVGLLTVEPQDRGHIHMSAHQSPANRPDRKRRGLLMPHTNVIQKE